MKIFKTHYQSTCWGVWNFLVSQLVLEVCNTLKVKSILIDKRKTQLYILLGDDFGNFLLLFLDTWVREKKSGSKRNWNSLRYLKLSENRLNVNIRHFYQFHLFLLCCLSFFLTNILATITLSLDIRLIVLFMYKLQTH